MYVRQSCVMPIFFFSLLSIYLHAQSINFMVHKVRHPDIVHKYSWKGCKAQPSEPCEQNNAPAGTSTLHLYIKSTSKMSLCKILGCTAHFLLAWGNINAKKPVFFLQMPFLEIDRYLCLLVGAAYYQPHNILSLYIFAALLHYSPQDY